jgi:hypothetical protein
MTQLDQKVRAALPRLAIPISLIRVVNGPAFKGLLMDFLVQAFPRANAKEPDLIVNTIDANRLVFGLECNHYALRLLDDPQSNWPWIIASCGRANISNWRHLYAPPWPF